MMLGQCQTETERVPAGGCLAELALDVELLTLPPPCPLNQEQGRQN